jgi:hypothetical protein
MIVATGGASRAMDAGAAARRWRRGAAAVRAEGGTRGPGAMESPSSMEAELIGAMNSKWHGGWPCNLKQISIATSGVAFYRRVY